MLEKSIFPVVLAILPVFLIILVGYFSRKFKILKKESNAALNQYVYYFALPAILFISIAKNPISNIINLNFIFAFLSGMVILYILMFAIAYVLKMGNIKQIGILALGVSSPNTAFMGIPILTILIGDHVITAVAFASVLLTVPMIISIFIIEAEKNAQYSLLKRAYKNIFPLLKNPIIISSFLGILFSALNIPIPNFLKVSLEQLGNTTGPCALFAIGQTLFGIKIIGNVKIRSFLLCAGKLFIHPLITLFFIYIFNVPAPFGMVALLLSAMPSAAIVFILAQKYSIYENEATSLVFETTLCSVLTIPTIAIVAAKILA